jgi:hypothetical protein
MPNAFRSVAYLQIRRKWLSIQVMTWAGRMGDWTGTPEALLMPARGGRQGQWQAYAPDDPRVQNAVHARPFVAFTHPRVAFDGIEETRLTLSVYLRKAGWRPQSGPWTYVVQLRDDWLDPLTDIESQAIIALGKRLGAKRVLIVSASRELTPPEVLQIARGPHPAAGQQPIALDHL